MQQTGMQEDGELVVPLLDEQHDETEQEQEQEIRSAGPEEGPAQSGDLEQGLVAFSHAGSEAGGSNKADEDIAIEAAARASRLTGPGVYFGDLFRLCIFYWAIVSDALLMKELYSNQYTALGGIATGFTVGPHVIMSLLLIVRQGWLQAASQACGFILTLNPFESLTPIPQGIVGLFVLSIGFIAYVLIAASGLIFVAYCVVCYLVTALLFSLLILDLAALVITVAPSKAIFKYTDLVYTENFKFSRLVLQAWLQSAPELVLVGLILYRNWSPSGPAVVVSGPILMQALAAHLLNFWDKSLLFRSSANQAGCSTGRQLLLLLGVKGSSRLSLPVLKENLGRVLRGAGGGSGAGLGSVLHISSFEEVPDTDSEAAASMVPEYLTPNNGGLLSPGQLMGLSHAVFGRYGGPEVAELVLEITPDVMVGKLLSQVASSVPNVSKVRLVTAGVRGADAAALATAMLQWGGLRSLQLHQVVVDERGAVALTRLLEATPTLQQLELCRCKLRRRAAVALAQGLRLNKTLRQLNLAGVKGLDDAGASALAAAVSSSKVLTALNLAFVKLSMAAVDSVVQAIKSSSSLRVVAISQADLPVEGARKIVGAITALTSPKAPPSLSCNLDLGTFPVDGLDGKVQFLVVQDQDALIMDVWQGVAGGADGSGDAVLEQGLAGTSPPAAAEAEGGEVELEPGQTAAAATSSSSSQTQQQQRSPSPHRAAAFGVVSSPAATPASIAAARASAAWFSGSSSSSDTFGQSQRPQAATAVSSSSSSGAAGGGSTTNGASSSKAAEAGPCSSCVCPCLMVVVVQQDCTDCMVKSPLLFEELDTLNLAGLGVGDAGATALAQTLSQNPNLRNCILTDNRIGEEGGTALAKALAINTSLQVLDLSANEFSESGVGVLADAARHAAGLRQLRLLGNKIPFGLETLRKLMQAEAANPHCRLVLVEDPSEVLDELETQGDGHQLARAADFYQRQDQYRQHRRQRTQARQQRLARILQRQEQQQQQQQQPETAALEAAEEGPSPSGGSSSSSSAGSGEQQQLQIVLHSAGSDASAAAATAATVAAAGSSVTPPPASSPRSVRIGSGSVSSITTDEDTCGICFDNSTHVAIRYCGHRLCVDCYRKVWELSGGASTCPFCRARLEGYMYLDWPLE